MTQAFARAAVSICELALAFFFFSLISSSVAFAHALPGSVITLSRQADLLNFQVSFPIEDLILSSSEFEFLDVAREDKEWTTQETNLLAAYFQSHILMQKEGLSLPFTVQAAWIETAFNEHVGSYSLLVTNLHFGLPKAVIENQTPLFPLMLQYHVIMHEVRNHRASVFLHQPLLNPMLESTADQLSGQTIERDIQGIKIADFGYRLTNGKPKTQILQLP